MSSSPIGEVASGQQTLRVEAVLAIKRRQALLGSGPPSANSEVVDVRRKTTRGVIFAAAAATVVGLTGGVSAAQSDSVPRLIFPVLGDVKFTDDFGDPRPQGPHEGNDLMAAKRSIAVAAEPGKIKFWTSSSAAGCMLYLFGKSGTTYLYIHLNNDLTKEDDNRGKCVPGTAYAKGLKDGAHVAAGQSVGYVGESGDAEGGDPHLHFEVHPNDADPTNPYPYLKRAEVLIFATSPRTTVTLSLAGVVTQAQPGQLTVKPSTLHVFPAATPTAKRERPVTLLLPQTAQLSMGGGRGGGRQTGNLIGKTVIVLTEPTLGTLAAAAARPGAFSVARVVLAPTPP